MDLASLIGLILGLVMVVFGIVTGDGGFTLLPNFIDVPSVIITIGGSVAGVIACNKLKDLGPGFKGMAMSMKEPGYNPAEMISSIINLANVARKEGLLALEEAASEIQDEFLKKGIYLVVDGMEPDLVRGIMDTDLMCIEDRHKKVIGFWEKWAELGPAWGMIGTLIGLVNMLKNLLLQPESPDYMDKYRLLRELENDLEIFLLFLPEQEVQVVFVLETHKFHSGKV